MPLLISKIVFAATIFFLTLITGLIPLKIAKHNVRLLSLCDAFACGIFLGASQLHLLPDAVAKFNEIYSYGYPLAYLISIITFIIMLIMERGIFIYGRVHFANTNVVAPVFLVLLLTIHSLIEGAAIGANTSFIEAAAIFFAVLAHKGSESFALATNLNRFGLLIKNIKQIIVPFSLMTPLGIFIGASIIDMSTINSGDLLVAALDAIAAGTFLYLGTDHLIAEKKSFERFSEVIALLFGVTLMAAVAIWV
jgi:zinc transporter ZupT